MYPYIKFSRSTTLCRLNGGDVDQVNGVASFYERIVKRLQLMPYTPDRTRYVCRMRRGNDKYALPTQQKRHFTYSYK